MEIVEELMEIWPNEVCDRLLESREYLAREGMAKRVPGAFAVTIGGVKVPQNFHETMEDPDSWWAPIVKEFNIMRARRVYELVERPLGVNVIGTKWVYVQKFDGNSRLSDRKARIVAQGFSKIQGVDFENTYIAIVASTELHLWQLNFVVAYLNSDIDFDVYIEQPKGFVEGGGDMVWKLRKTLYGTMQGGHN